LGAHRAAATADKAAFPFPFAFTAALLLLLPRPRRRGVRSSSEASGGISSTSNPFPTAMQKLRIVILGFGTW
jgi:hypothetical protein